MSIFPDIVVHARIRTVSTDNQVAFHTGFILEYNSLPLIIYASNRLSKDDLDPTFDCLIVENIPSILPSDVPVPTSI